MWPLPVPFRSGCGTWDFVKSTQGGDWSLESRERAGDWTTSAHRMSASARPPIAAQKAGLDGGAAGLAPQWAAKRGAEGAWDGKVPPLSLGGHGAPAVGGASSSRAAEGGGSFKLPQRPQSAAVIRRSASDGGSGSKFALRVLNVDPSAPILPREGQPKGPNKAVQPLHAGGKENAAGKENAGGKESGPPTQPERTEYSSPRNRIECRPLSAMANMSRGLASCAEKEQIEELKREILDITRSIPAGGRGGSSRRACKETEEALTRFVFTNDTGQVQLAKNALLAIVLQKQEEYGRRALLETGTQTRGGRSPGEAKRDGPQGRFGAMQKLHERAVNLKESLLNKTREHDAALLEAQAAKQESSKLREECDLMRAALMSSHGAAKKMFRPFSAPRQRSAVMSEPSISSSACGSCEGSEGRARSAEDEARNLQAKLLELQAMLDDVRQRSGEDAGKLGDRVAKLEELLALKSSTITGLEKSLKSSAADLKKALDELKTLKANDKAAVSAARIKELEKQNQDSEHARREAAAELASAHAKAAELKEQLAGANDRIAALEKELAGCQERLKALGSAAGREEELFAKNEALVRSLREAQDEALKLRETLAKEREEAERLRTLLREQKDEADACNGRLIKQVRDLMAKAREQEIELASKSEELRGLKAAESRLSERIKELEESNRDLTASQGDASIRDRQIEELKHKLTALTRELATSQAHLEDLRRQYDGLKFIRERDLGEIEVLRSKVSELRAQLDKARMNALNPPELAVLRDKLATATKVHDAMERKLHTVLLKAEASEQRALESERERDETRAIEATFKEKMRAMYEKRVRELQQVQKEQEPGPRESQEPGTSGLFASSSHTATFGSRRR